MGILRPEFGRGIDKLLDGCRLSFPTLPHEPKTITVGQTGRTLHYLDLRRPVTSGKTVFREIAIHLTFLSVLKGQANYSGPGISV